MTVGQDRTRLIAATALSVAIVFCYYFLYQKYHALSVCQQQSLQLDSLENKLRKSGR
jgi:hypothetical protein